ncbi:Nucleoporin nup84, partial [Coemansia sp. RSA 2618]
QSEARYWRSESNTWDLIERLYTLRQQARGDDGEHGMALEESTQPTTDFVSVQALMDSDAQLSEYVEVRRWLEDTAPEFQAVETRKGYLFYTRRSIREREQTQGSGAKRSQIVTEIDPDAASRQRRDLAPEDAEYSRSLLRTLYEYVRRGRVGNAMDLCVESDEPWRAASIKGGLFWREPRLEADDAMPVDASDGSALDVRPQHAAGNINRALWKHACAALAHDEANDTYERALYAALCGRLDEVVLACESWEDFVWAHVNAMIEARIDRGISGTNRLYAPAPATSFAHVQSRHPQAADMAQVFDSIATHDSAALQRAAAEPFHRLQRALVTDSFAAYLAEYARGLQTGALARGDAELLRVVVHVTLHVRQLGFALPEAAVDAVLTAYVDELARDHRELVAVYVAHMPAARQTAAFARFVHALDIPRPLRMQLLRTAELHGLDVDAISRLATELAVSSGEPDAPKDTFVLAEPAEPVTAAELAQVRALEWATSSPRLYTYALIETCKLARRFLLRGRTNAATQLFNALPADFVQQEWIDSAQSGGSVDSVARGGAVASSFQEYIHMLSLCDAFAFYATWAEALCRRPVVRDGQSRLQMQWLEWKEGIVQATGHAVQMFRTRLLDVDWLGEQSLFIGSSDADARRTGELSRLRAVYVPEAVFRLHALLFDTRDAVPQNLKRSLDLAQLVAGDALGIYRQLAKPSPEHPNGRLPAFMGLMRRSAFEILRVQQESLPDKPPLLVADSSIGLSSLV